MMGRHERPVEPFADLHVEHGRVRATLLADPTVDGLDLAIYVDGSSARAPGGGLWAELFGWGEAPEAGREPQARWLLEYLATKDSNGLLRVAYWACGGHGRDTEVIGELQSDNVGNFQFPGPRYPGDATVLEPAFRDYVAYMRDQVRNGARRGCAVILCGGPIHDTDAVSAYAEWIAKEVRTGGLPRMNFILVTVGDAQPLPDLAYPGYGRLLVHRIAADTGKVAELVAGLIDETVPVAAGGRILDDHGDIVAAYEGRLPAVLEFDVHSGCRSFTLEANGLRYTQRLSDAVARGDDDGDET